MPRDIRSRAFGLALLLPALLLSPGSPAAAEDLQNLRRAADRGEASAQTRLGVCFAEGQGVPFDYSEAVRWFRKAAERGYPPAQADLGIMHEHGLGIPQNLPEAARWYRKAAVQGSAIAQYNLAWMLRTGDGIPQDKREAAGWYRRAAEQDMAKAQFFLGWMLETGDGISRDPVEAARWYRKAAEQGNAAGQFRLGDVVRKGEGVSKNRAEAAKWYRKAAEQGHVGAREALIAMGEKAPAPSARAGAAPPAEKTEWALDGAPAASREKERKPPAFTADVDQRVPLGRKGGEHDVAVLVANQRYQAAGVPPVDFAERDIETMKEYIVKTMGFPPENILEARNATLSRFNELFGTSAEHRMQVYNFVKPGVSRLFIYYVGHGAPDLNSREGDAYFVPVDANPDFIAAGGYRLTTFYENIAKIPAKSVTIVLEACFSGNFHRGSLLKGISPALVKVKKKFRRPANGLYISSSDVDQVSAWYPEKRHSLFTYFFLKGLGGEADANRDRKITAGEIREYLGKQVPSMARRLRGVVQTPIVIGDDKVVLAILN